MDDYLELPLYIEDLAEDKAIDLWVMGEDGDAIAVLKNVDSCIRYKGWWSISHNTFFTPMTALIPSGMPVYFNTREVDANA